MTITLPSDSRLLKKSFTFGVATSSYQIEGAHQEGQRCPSIWDTFCRKEGKVLNADNGDIACDHYHRWKEDVELIDQLGVDAYRLSIAWPRIIAEDGSVLEQGLRFYEQLVDELNGRNIKPFVTLYHWDLPQYLEDKGGWLNRETAYKFAEFAEVVTQRLGDKVAAYATLNEPWCSGYLGYRSGVHAPGLKDEKAGFQAVHHLLLAHGLALPAMRKAAPAAQQGIVLNLGPNYPLTDSPEDIAAARFADDEHLHFFLEPLLKGTYPQSVMAAWPEKMPLVLEGDMEIIAAPIDYLGVNYYTRGVVKAASKTIYEQVRAEELLGRGVERTHIGWEVFPQGLTDLLVDINRDYKLPPVFITENGMAGDDHLVNGKVEDEQRVRYLNSHLNAVDQAIRKGVDVKGYFAWSLMDNFEWAEGYSQRFGIVYVDYESQERTLKQSAVAYSQLLKERVK